MKRISLSPRPAWQTRVESVGLVYHSVDGVPYWDESVCHKLAASEIDTLDAVREELQQLCLAARQFIVENDRSDDLCFR